MWCYPTLVMSLFCLSTGVFRNVLQKTAVTGLNYFCPVFCVKTAFDLKEDAWPKS